MIVVLGASGYIGRAFASELRRRGRSFIPLTRDAFDYTRFDFLFDYVRTMRPLFLINAASYSGENRGSQAERETLMAVNAILPQMIARVCVMTKTPWAHVSSGTIYSGAKIAETGGLVVHRDLGKPHIVEQFHEHPERFRGFTELDEPNFTFRNFPCNFYSGTKALAEETIRDIGEKYIWRFQMPFDDSEISCNWLSAMRKRAVLQDSINSFSQLSDGVKACLDLWECRAPYGIYNVVNPGAVSTRQICEEIQRVLRIKPAMLGEGADGRTPLSNCILDGSKMLRAGVKVRPVEEAVTACLERLQGAEGWRKAELAGCEAGRG